MEEETDPERFSFLSKITPLLSDRLRVRVQVLHWGRVEPWLSVSHGGHWFPRTPPTSVVHCFPFNFMCVGHGKLRLDVLTMLHDLLPCSRPRCVEEDRARICECRAKPGLWGWGGWDEQTALPSSWRERQIPSGHPRLIQLCSPGKDSGRQKESQEGPCYFPVWVFWMLKWKKERKQKICYVYSDFKSKPFLWKVGKRRGLIWLWQRKKMKVLTWLMIGLGFSLIHSFIYSFFCLTNACWVCTTGKALA